MAFLVLAIAAIVFGIIGAFVAPGTALAAAMCVYSFETLMQAKVPFFAAHGSFANFASAVIVMSAFISASLRGKISVRRLGLIQYSILAFYLLRLFSYFWAVDRSWWISVTGYDAPYALVYLFVLPFVYSNWKDFELGIKTTAIFGAIIIALLLLTTPMHAWGRYFDVEEGVINRYGEMERGGSPLAITELAGQVTLLMTLIAWRHAKVVWIAMKITILVVCCAIIFQTDTRGQLISLVLTMCTVVLFRWPKLDVRFLIGVPIFLVIFGLAIYWGSGFSIRAERWDPARMMEDYSGTRFVLASTLLGEWIRGTPWNFLFGMGNGIAWHYLDVYPHMIVVEVLAENGIVGLSLYLLIIAAAAKAFLSSASMAKDNDMIRSIACCLMAMMLFDFILSFKQGGTNAIHYLLIAPALLGGLESSLRAAAKHKPPGVYAPHPLHVPVGIH